MADINDLKKLLAESGYAGSIDFDPTKPFGDLNIDSLDVFAWISSSEESFGVKIVDDEIEAIATPNDLLNLINSKIS